MLRLLTGQLPPADWLLGVSTVQVGPFVFGTAIGIIPGIVVITAVGGNLYSWIGGDPRRWVPLLVVAIAATVIARRRRRAAA